MINRPILASLVERLREPRRFIQVLVGPRQVGKTTLARQVMDDLSVPCHYATADEPAPGDRAWLGQQWDIARLMVRRGNDALLVLDEVQKIPHWSDLVKLHWDEDSRTGTNLKVLLLGSSQLLIERGLGDSLAGRFEIIPVRHWTYGEMKAAFGMTLEQYLYFGGYPGAAPLIDDRPRWARYILDSLVETALARDILMMTRIDKPVLLRRLFQLGCEYSGRELSYTKMLGQLQDAGNTTTLANYMELLAGAGLVAGLQKYAGHQVRRRGSSPKLQVLNTALLSAHAPYDLEAALRQRDFWGRLVESAIGAHILNGIVGSDIACYYWREKNAEVDFVMRRGDMLTAIEVKSGRVRDTLPGMDAFAHAFKPGRTLLVGGQGIPVDKFLSTPVGEWVENG